MPYVVDDLNWQGFWGSQYFLSTDFLHYDGRYLGGFICHFINPI